MRDLVEAWWQVNAVPGSQLRILADACTDLVALDDSATGSESGSTCEDSADLLHQAGIHVVVEAAYHGPALDQRVSGDQFDV